MGSLGWADEEEQIFNQSSRSLVELLRRSRAGYPTMGFWGRAEQAKDRGRYQDVRPCTNLGRYARRMHQDERRWWDGMETFWRHTSRKVGLGSATHTDNVHAVRVADGLQGAPWGGGGGG